MKIRKITIVYKIISSMAILDNYRTIGKKLFNQPISNQCYLASLLTLTSHFEMCYSSMLLLLLPLSKEQKNNERLLIIIYISITYEEEMGLRVRIITKENDLSESTWRKILDKV